MYVLQNQDLGCKLRVEVLVQNGRKNCGCELSIVGAKCVVAREKCFAKSSARLRTTWSVGGKCEEEFWM